MRKVIDAMQVENFINEQKIYHLNGCIWDSDSDKDHCKRIFDQLFTFIQILPDMK